MLASSLPRKKRGTRLERSIAKDLAKICESFRVKGSGAIPGLPGDVLSRLTDRQWEIEAKYRSQLPQVLMRWLGGADLLVIEAENGERVVMMPWPEFIELVRAAQSPAAQAGEAPSPPALPAPYRWPKRQFQRRVA